MLYIVLIQTRIDFVIISLIMCNYCYFFYLEQLHSEDNIHLSIDYVSYISFSIMSVLTRVNQILPNKYINFERHLTLKQINWIELNLGES